MSKIDFNESFPTLVQEPITEVVFSIRVKNDSKWVEEQVLEILKEKMPGFSLQSVSDFTQEFTFNPGKQPKASQSATWTGVICFTDDKKTLVTFDRNFLRFNKLPPYPGWEKFLEQGIGYWDIYKTLQEESSLEIEGLGLRYINKVPVPEAFDMGEYLQEGPRIVSNLDVSIGGFLHQEELKLNDYPYFSKVTKFVQQEEVNDQMQSSIILDIDCSAQAFKLVEVQDIRQHLIALRWLKNKVFFGTFVLDKLEALS